DIAQGPPPDRPLGRPPFGGPPPLGPIGEDTFLLGDRLILLGSDGERIAGSADQSDLFESLAICSDAACTAGNVLGFIGLNAPLSAQTASDTFFLRRQYSSLALSALIAILVSAGAALVVARHILTPIRQLEAGAKTMASGDYSTRIDLKRDDELGQLISHYNALAATLERTAKAEREWISNTSHELQTPLATLRAQIEAVQDGIRKPDPETFAQMHAAMMRLSHLVEDVKILSHSREKAFGTTLHDEDLSEIARTTAVLAQPLFAAKNMELLLILPATAHVVCDRQRIGQVVDNLLQNAARYTNAPGSVRLTVQATSDAVQLSVDDTPPAPRDEDLPRLFDRFFRAESSRSRAHGGSGLGLSVCKAIVDSHGGTITSGLSDMGGLCVTISLPKAAK
ncbi:ATP-binding protein, partial [Octadecabacter sp.]|nr:ATP-binding protein [Octadecabacter sp.]